MEVKLPFRDSLLALSAPHYLVEVFIWYAQLLSLYSKRQFLVYIFDVYKRLANEVFCISLFWLRDFCFLLRLIEMFFVFHFGWPYLQESFIFFLTFKQLLGLWRKNFRIDLSHCFHLTTLSSTKTSLIMIIGLTYI